jgi:integral membrane sensor domain MASE1
VKPGRLKTSLVYVGLLEDETEHLIDAPMNPWRRVASGLAVVVGVAVALTALALVGGAPTWADAVGLIAVLLGVSAGAAIKRRRR